MTTTITIETLTVDNALYNKYPQQQTPQPCYVELDCEAHTLSASYNGEIGNAVPFSVHYGRVLRWTIPCLTNEVANELLTEIEPLAIRICDGYEQVWSGSNFHGRLDDDAEAAALEIQMMCDSDWTDADQVQVWSADDWYASTSDAELIEARSIEATDDDEQIKLMADLETDEAADQGYTVENVFEYLKMVRDRIG